MASWDGRLLNAQVIPPSPAVIRSGGASVCSARQESALVSIERGPAFTHFPPWYSWIAVMVRVPPTGAVAPTPAPAALAAEGALRSRSCSTHGQPVSDPVKVAGPFEGTVPRWTGEERVVTSADSVAPAGVTLSAWKVIRIAEPDSTTGAGAGGASWVASCFSDGWPGWEVQVATWANRC